ncbi:MAG: hypothetical protein C0613_12780 [Desulfobulbaceae bacterium]|nr:MAG: hypothetical protein C0613_12780 [Desulfobulbaceae bacterium]
MSALIQLLSKNQTIRGKAHWLALLGKRFAHLSEAFWFTTSLVLFLVLGPFSAIVALIGLGSLATKGRTQHLQGPAKV